MHIQRWKGMQGNLGRCDGKRERLGDFQGRQLLIGIILEHWSPKYIKSKTDRQTDLLDRDEGEGSKEGTKKTGLQCRGGGKETKARRRNCAAGGARPGRGYIFSL